MNQPFEHACEQCRYFKPGDALSSSCRRFPPVFAGDSSPRETHHWRFPAVGLHGWCGEFLPAPAVQVSTTGVGI